eukprot:TRINITY_DN206_c3_g1_i1.p1 TRINITY_DN206_c3_g1~~TRINITY_DN206_c3_g1_i1.p1  ORF type:complete len:268 (-),score=-25.40 TRINITY_DN206_c3_g1_i1:69-872(-)
MHSEQKYQKKQKSIIRQIIQKVINNNSVNQIFLRNMLNLVFRFSIKITSVPIVEDNKNYDIVATQFKYIIQFYFLIQSKFNLSLPPQTKAIQFCLFKQYTQQYIQQYNATQFSDIYLDLIQINPKQSQQLALNYFFVLVSQFSYIDLQLINQSINELNTQLHNLFLYLRNFLKTKFGLIQIQYCIFTKGQQFNQLIRINMFYFYVVKILHTNYDLIQIIFGINAQIDQPINQIRTYGRLIYVQTFSFSIFGLIQIQFFVLVHKLIIQ